MALTLFYSTGNRQQILILPISLTGVPGDFIIIHAQTVVTMKKAL